MKCRRSWAVILTIVGLLLAGAAAAVADEAVIKQETAINAAANGTRIGSLLTGTKFNVLDRQTNWYRGEVTFHIWSASVSAGAGNTASVTVDRENLRLAPQGARMGTLNRGVSFTVLERSGQWVKGKTTFWVWSPSVAELVDIKKLEAINQYWRARGYLDRGQLGLALKAAQKTVELVTPYPQAYFLIGLIQKERGDTLAALAAYRQTIAQNEDYAEAYVNMGSIYQRDALFDTAIGYYRKAIARNRTIKEAYVNLGSALQVTGRIDDAVNVFELYAQAIPQDATHAYYYIGEAEQARLVAANNALAQALAARDTAEQRQQRAAVERYTAAALAAYHRAIEIDSTYATAYVSIGRVNLISADYDAAIQYFRAAINRDRDCVEGHFCLAETLHALDRDTEAVTAYEALSVVEPQNPLPYYNNACIYALAHNRDAAVSWFRRGAMHMPMDMLNGARRDADLQLLWDDEEFRVIIENAKSARRAAGLP
ncbi:MAG TPA: tetratricopeptide repeat protein [bacterium]|nr:tetratricopeptide repeat protein [bacterium]